MSEKVRGGLFAALGDISELTVLDAYAGSGAISYEAISRGAKSATAIDIDKNAAKSIKENSVALGIADRLKVVRANCSGWSDNNPEAKFDIIVCDPPFDDIKISQIQKLSEHLKDTGIFVASISGSLKPFELKNLTIVKNKTYGDAQLVFYKKIG